MSIEMRGILFLSGAELSGWSEIGSISRGTNALAVGSGSTTPPSIID